MSNQLHHPMISRVSRDVRQLSPRVVSYLWVWSNRTLWMSRKCSVLQLVLMQELFEAQIPKKICEHSPSCWNSGLPSRCHAPVEIESLLVICDPMPNATSGILSRESNGIQESRGDGTRDCTDSRPGRGQKGGRRVQQRKRAAAHAQVCTFGFWTWRTLIHHLL